MQRRCEKYTPPQFRRLEKDFHKIADLVYNNNLLEPDGMLIIEHSKQTQIDNHPNFSFDER